MEATERAQEEFIERAEGAYAECAEWCDSEYLNEETKDWTLTDEGIARLVADVRPFILDNWEDCSQMEAEQVGHDFWLTRCRHGAGFWDHGLGELGDRLTKVAQSYGEDWLGEYVTYDA